MADLVLDPHEAAQALLHGGGEFWSLNTRPVGTRLSTTTEKVMLFTSLMVSAYLIASSMPGKALKACCFVFLPMLSVEEFVGELCLIQAGVYLHSKEVAMAF